MKNAGTRSKDRVLYFRVVEYNGEALVFAPPKKPQEHDRLMKATRFRFMPSRVLPKLWIF